MTTAVTGAGPGPAPAVTPIVVVIGEPHPRVSRAVDISIGGGASVSASRQVLAGAACELTGFRVIEPTGLAKMEFQLWDGTSSGGQLLAVGGAPSGGVDYAAPTEPGVLVATGKIYLQVVSGALAGVLYWR